MDRNVDVLIVGSGPSGMSTALHLVKQDPSWCDRILVIDKAVHPRPKLCGGGVSRFALGILENLGLEFEPPFFSVNEIRIIFENNSYSLLAESILRVTRRDELDSWLVRKGEQQGIEVRQGAGAVDLLTQPDHIAVVTEEGVWRAKVVVAADGASSLVRQKLRWGGQPQTARLLEVLTPEVPAETAEFRDRVAVFDFSPTMHGLQGYYWDFPSIVAGQPFMNRGVFDSRMRPELPRVALKDEFSVQLAVRGRDLSEYELKGHPIRWFSAEAEFAKPRILLVGDAAGTDPLFGEGIPFALAYGEAAASQVADAFALDDFSFRSYKERILQHRLLKQLRRRASGAHFLYGLSRRPALARTMWRLAPVMFGFLAQYKPQYIPMENPHMLRRTAKK